MFGIGGFELFIILIFGFLIFGPDKLPDIARTVGRGIARFREAQQEVNEAIGDEKIIDLNNPDEPFKDPIEALDRIAKRQEEKKAGVANSNARPSQGTVGSAKSAPADAPADAGQAEAEPKQESFTERKARYERERAARKAAEAEAAASGSQAEAAEAASSGSGAKASDGSEGSEAEGSRPSSARSTEAPADGGDA